MGLTRKEIQQDRIRTILTDIYQWAMVYQGYLIGAVVVAVLLMLAGYGWNSYRQGQNRAAQEAFSDAVSLYHAPLEGAGDEQAQPGDPGQRTFASEEERDASTREALENVLEGYSGTSVVPWARYYLALLDERTGQADQARQALDNLSRQSEVPEVRNLAALRLAEQAQQQGRYQEAIDYWNSLLGNTASHFPIQGTLFQLAGAYEKNGDNQQALEQYRRLQDEWPTSTQAREARVRIAALEALLESSGQPEGSDQSDSQPETSDPAGPDSDR